MSRVQTSSGRTPSRPRGRAALALALALVPAPALHSGSCDGALDRALAREDAQGRIEGLELLLDWCPEHVPTLLATGELLREARGEISGDWLQRSLESYEKVLLLDPSHVEARAWTAALLAYAGVYAGAIEHYAALQQLDAARARDSGAQLQIPALGFLKSLVDARASAAALQRPGDQSERAVRHRSGWDSLERLLASTLAARQEESVEIPFTDLMRALFLVKGWMKEPCGADVLTRNRQVVGIVSLLASVNEKVDLSDELADLVVRSGGEIELDWPAAGFAPDDERLVSEVPLPRDRTLTVEPDRTVTAHHKSPLLHGEWKARCDDHLRDTPVQAPSPLWEKPVTFAVSAAQRGSRLEMSWKAEGKKAGGEDIVWKCQLTPVGRVMNCTAPKGAFLKSYSLTCQLEGFEPEAFLCHVPPDRGSCLLHRPDASPAAHPDGGPSR